MYAAEQHLVWDMYLASKLNLHKISSARVSGDGVVKLLISHRILQLKRRREEKVCTIRLHIEIQLHVLTFFVVFVGWMCDCLALSPWAPSRRQTLTAWRSSSSIMTSTTAGTWQQRLTGIMKTVQHAFSNAHASRLLQVWFTLSLSCTGFTLDVRWLTK